MRDYIEVYTWDNEPWMVRIKSITRIVRGENNRTIIYINNNFKMECVETYDWFKERFGDED